MENELNENLNSTIEETVEEKVESTEPKEEEVEKPQETLEAKRARLERQLNQVNKKLGVEKPKESKSKDFGLVEKTYLKTIDVVAPDEIELFKKLQKETGLDIEQLAESKYFKTELQDLRDKKAIETATTGIRGSGTGTDPKNSPEYWISKGIPPTADQVPDRKVRVKIAQAMMNNQKSGKKFYND